MDRSLFPGLPAFCLPHSPANSTILIHLQHFYTPSTTPPTPHFISIVSRHPVVLLNLSPPPHPPSYSFSPLLDLFLPLSFSSSISPGRNALSAKPRPNPLIFLHVVTAPAAIPLFLRPFLLCWANGQHSDLRLAATCCNFSSWHVGAPH